MVRSAKSRNIEKLQHAELRYSFNAGELLKLTFKIITF